jgi:hypothetical protein
MKLKELLSLTLSESLYIFLSLNLPCPPSSLLPLWISQSLCLFRNQTQQRLMMGWSMRFVYSSSWWYRIFSNFDVSAAYAKSNLWAPNSTVQRLNILCSGRSKKKNKTPWISTFYGPWGKGIFYAPKLIMLKNNINYILKFYLIIKVIELRWFFNMVSEAC